MKHGPEYKSSQVEKSILSCFQKNINNNTKSLFQDENPWKRFMALLFNCVKLFERVVPWGFLEKHFLASCLWSSRWWMCPNKHHSRAQAFRFFHVTKQIDLFSVVSEWFGALISGLSFHQPLSDLHLPTTSCRVAHAVPSLSLPRAPDRHPFLLSRKIFCPCP